MEVTCCGIPVRVDTSVPDNEIRVSPTTLEQIERHAYIDYVTLTPEPVGEGR